MKIANDAESFFQHLKIVYVEDDDCTRQAMTVALRQHLPNLIAASSGEEGLLLFQEQRPDMVISDVKMSGMDGIRMAVAIKELSPDTPVILLSAFGSVEVLSAAIDAGVDDFMTKPVRVPKLLEKVRKHAGNLFRKQFTNYHRAHLEAVTRNMGEGLLVMSSKKEILYANSMAVTTLGYPQYELMGKKCEMLFPPDVRNTLPQVLDCPVSDNNICNPVMVELEMQKKDGTVFPIACKMSCVYAEDGELCYVAVFEDIADRKRKERELETFTRFLDGYRRAVDVSSLVLKLDRSGTIVYLNKRFTETLGYTFEDLVGRNWRDLRSLSAKRAMLDELWRKAVGGSVTTGELQVTGQNGLKFFMQIDAIPIQGEDGTTAEVIVLLKDVSQLRRALDDAEVSARVKSEFLATMSHEIRTPLNSIIGFLDLLRHTGLNSTQQKYLDYINSSAKTLMNVLNNVLDLSRSEQGKLELSITPFDLRAEMADTIDSFTAIAREKGVSLSAALDAGLKHTYSGDPHRIRQIVGNLLSNAIKFTPEKGSVGLRVKMLDADGDFDRLSFSVTDTGIGIPQEKWEEIFAPFVQADQSVARQYGGSGLGLAICASLLRLMHSSMFVESKPGEGSSFSFVLRLPAGIEYEPQQTAPGGLTDLPDVCRCPEPLQVLVAEDNEVNQELLKVMLDQFGVVCTIAPDGADAVDAASRQKFDVILMDVNMPRMDGLKAAEMLRKTLGDTCPPIIALTANALKGDREMCIVAGMCDYLPKPVNRDQLRRVLVHWGCERKGTKMQRIAEPHRSAPSAQAAFDKAEAAEKVGLSVDQYDMLFAMFADRLGGLLERIKNGIAEGDLEEVFQAGHKLKGSAASLGIDSVAHMALQIEQPARRGEDADYVGLFRLLESAVKGLQTEVQ